MINDKFGFVVMSFTSSALTLSTTITTWTISALTISTWRISTRWMFEHSSSIVVIIIFVVIIIIVIIIIVVIIISLTSLSSLSIPTLSSMFHLQLTFERIFDLKNVLQINQDISFG